MYQQQDFVLFLIPTPGTWFKMRWKAQTFDCKLVLGRVRTDISEEINNQMKLITILVPNKIPSTLKPFCAALKYGLAKRSSNFVDMDAFLTKPVPIERSFRVLSIGTGFVKNESISTKLLDLKVNPYF